MGFVDKPELRDYWSRNPRLHYPAISTRISKDRFEEITRCIHFVHNDTLLKISVTTVELRCEIISDKAQTTDRLLSKLWIQQVYYKHEIKCLMILSLLHSPVENI